MALHLFPLATLEDVVVEIGNLPHEVYQKLRQHISSEFAFDDHPERIQLLARDMNTSTDDALTILQAVEILYERVQLFPPEAERRGAISDFVGEFESDSVVGNREAIIDRLDELTVRSDAAERNKKIRRLENGFLATAQRFSSFVDLRPDFTESRDAIRGYVPVIQFRVETNSDKPLQQEMVFQLNEFGLERLRAAVDDANIKLDRLRAQQFASPFLKIQFRRQDR